MGKEDWVDVEERIVCYCVVLFYCNFLFFYFFVIEIENHKQEKNFDRHNRKLILLSTLSHKMKKM